MLLLLLITGAFACTDTQPSSQRTLKHDDASASPKASARAEDTAPVEAQLPFDPDDDHLDVVAAWSIGVKGATPTPLSRTAQPWGAPVHGSLRVELWQRLADFRVRLLDGNGRLIAHEVLVGQVPAHPHRQSVEPGGTWIQVTAAGGFPPSVPIRVVIDGENGPRPIDIHGKGYQDLVLDLVGDSPAATISEGDGGPRPIGSEALP